MGISPQDCLLAIRVRNEEQRLPQFLEHHDPFYDKLIAVVDRSDDTSYSIIRNHPKCIYIAERIYGHYDQHSDWDVLKGAANSYKHKWLWFLDVDEFVCYSFLEEMKQVPPHVVDVSFAFLTLLPDTEHFISGNHPYAMPHPRHKLHRRLHNYEFSLHYHVKGERTISFPAWLAQSFIHHHNMLGQKSRQDRFDLYMSIDPEDYGEISDRYKRYKHIIDVATARILPLSKIQTRAEMSNYLEQNKPKDDIQKLADNLQFLKFLGEIDEN